MYAHVKEDGSVDYLGSLPKSWGNVSGLRLSDGDNEYLKNCSSKGERYFPTHEGDIHTCSIRSYG